MTASLTAQQARAALRKAKNEKWENLLAYHLRMRKLDKLFVREFIMPESTRKFRWDFADPMNKVLLEVQGGIWSPGKAAHSNGTGIMRDQEKLNLAQFHGYRVFQCNDNTINDQTFPDMLALFYAQKLGLVPGGQKP